MHCYGVANIEERRAPWVLVVRLEMLARTSLIESRTAYGSVPRPLVKAVVQAIQRKHRHWRRRILLHRPWPTIYRAWYVATAIVVHTWGRGLSHPEVEGLHSERRLASRKRRPMFQGSRSSFHLLLRLDRATDACDDDVRLRDLLRGQDVGRYAARERACVGKSEWFWPVKRMAIASTKGPFAGKSKEQATKLPRPIKYTQ